MTADNEHKALTDIESNELTEACPNLTECKKESMLLEKSGRPVTDDTPPDGGWGWVVVIATTMMLIVISTLLNSFSILIAEYSVKFQVGYGKLGFIMGANMIALHFTGALCSQFVVHYGCRLVAMTGFSVAGVSIFLASFANSIWYLAGLYAIAGCGLGLCYLSCFVCVQHYFTKKRALASGITMTGFSISSLIIPSLTKWLLTKYSWRGTLMIIAALHIQAIPLASLLKPLNLEKHYYQDTKAPKKLLNNESKSYRDGFKEFIKNMFPLDILLNKHFFAYGIGTLASNLGLLTFLSHTPELTRTLLYANGVTDDYISATMLTAYGITSCLFRCLSGLVGSYLPIDRVALCAFGIIMAGLTTSTVGLFNNHQSILIVSVIIGIFSGIFAGVQITALADMMGVHRIAKSAGLLQLFNGVAGITAIPFSGMMRDISGDYLVPFMVMGLLETAGGLLIMCIPAYRLIRQHITHSL